MNAFDEPISRVDTVEERMNELEYKSIEITQTKREKEKKKITAFKSFGEI